MIKVIIESVVTIVILLLCALLVTDEIKRLPQFFAQLRQKVPCFFRKPKNIMNLIAVLLVILVMIDRGRREAVFSFLVSMLILFFLAFMIRRWIKSNLKL